MATYTLQTAFIKFAKETLPDGATANASVKVSIGSLWNQELYYKISIINQGTLSWTFDDDTTEKTGNLGAGATSSITLPFKTTSIPTETTKDQLQLKVSYYKNNDYTGLISEDTINLDIYMLIQQSDGTWGSPSNNLDEDTVVFDVLDDDASNYNIWNFTLQKGRANVHVDHDGYTSGGYDTGVLHNYSFVYWKNGTCSGGGHVHWYINDASGNHLTGKIIAIIHKESGNGTHRFELWKGSTHVGPDYDPGTDMWRKLIFPLPKDFWLKFHLYNGPCDGNKFWVDFIGIFNKF